MMQHHNSVRHTQALQVLLQIAERHEKDEARQSEQN
jgi:hypothetical protein